MKMTKARLEDAVVLMREDMKGFLAGAAARMAEKGGTKDPIVKRLRRMEELIPRYKATLLEVTEAVEKEDLEDRRKKCLALAQYGCWGKGALLHFSP